MTSWWQPATQTNRDLNPVKTLAKFNQEHRKLFGVKDNVFGYELQFVLSEVLPVCHNLNCKLHGGLPDVLSNLTKSSKNIFKSFPSSRGVTRRHVMRHFASNGADQCQNDSTNLLTPYRSTLIYIYIQYMLPNFKVYTVLRIR